MALLDLWNNDRQQVAEKRIQQLIAFAGEGKLMDGGIASKEIRDLLTVVPSDALIHWIDECLVDRFTGFGFVLQDIVNEVGHRLGYKVRHGVYRGSSALGFDGLWQMDDGRAILIESKASAAYSIDLDKVAGYRRQVSSECGIAPEDISILLIMGAEDTGPLEAQVRGSRVAWSVRLLGIRALLRLLQLRETLDDPAVARQIQEILIPQEFTRLDRIVDLVFLTAEDAQSTTDEVEEPSGGAALVETNPKANFHAEILPRLEQCFGKPLVKRSRVQWETPDGSIRVSCQVSKEFDRQDRQFWFGLKRTTKESLQSHSNAHCAFGLGSPDLVLLMPFAVVEPQLERMNVSLDENGEVLHWHLAFGRTKGRVEMIVSREGDRVDVSKYLIGPSS